MHDRMNDLHTDDLPPPRHGLPVPAKPAAALDVPADAGDIHPDDAKLIDRLRREVRAMAFEPLTDDEVGQAVVAYPSAAASNAIEGNPFTAADWALTRMLLEERVPTERQIEVMAGFSRECQPDSVYRGVMREGEARRG